MACFLKIVVKTFTQAVFTQFFASFGHKPKAEVKSLLQSWKVEDIEHLHYLSKPTVPKGLFNGMNKGVKASAVQIFDDITLIIQGEMIVPS